MNASPKPKSAKFSFLAKRYSNLERIGALRERAGLVRARHMAQGRAKGRSRSALNTIIAAVSEANDCVVVTDNEKIPSISRSSTRQGRRGGRK